MTENRGTLMTKDQKRDLFKDNILAWKKQIAESLPSSVDPNRFLRIIMTEFTKKPELQDTDPMSQYQAIMTLATWGLEPALGQAHLEARGQKGSARKVCTMQIDYKGLIELARRGGMIVDIWGDVVYSDDTYAFEVQNAERVMIHKKTTNPKLNQKGERDDADIVAAYVVLVFKDGTRRPEWMWRWELDRIVNRSAFTSSPMWRHWRPEAYLKTVLKRALKYNPHSTPDVHAAVTVDDQVVAGVKPELDAVIGRGRLEEPKPGPEPEKKAIHYMARIRDGKSTTYCCSCTGEVFNEQGADAHTKEASAKGERVVRTDSLPE